MGDDQHGAGGERSAIAVAQDRVIHLSAALPIRPATAFEHFTNNELLQAWLARVADVELRIGGRYELFWDPAHREANSTIGCRITAIAEPELLAFQAEPSSVQVLRQYRRPPDARCSGSYPTYSSRVCCPHDHRCRG